MTRSVLIWAIPGLALLAAPDAGWSQDLALEFGVNKAGVPQAYLKNKGDKTVSVALGQLSSGFTALDRPGATGKLTDAEIERTLTSEPNVLEHYTRPVAILALVREERHRGDLVIPPTAAFQIATLRKGQKARIPRDALKAAAEMPRVLEEFDRIARAKKSRTWSLRYTVSEFWGQQLGIWSGTLQAEAVALDE